MFNWHRPTSVKDMFYLLFGFQYVLAAGLIYTVRLACYCFTQMFMLGMYVTVVLMLWKHAPKKLPSTRKRALTIPLPRPATLSLLLHGKQKTIQQTNSYLYSKLPFEVRRQIFELAICGDGNVLHVFRDLKKMRVWRCRKQVDDQPCSWTYPCSIILPCNGLGMTDDGRPATCSKLTRPRDWGCTDLEHGNTWGIMSLLCSSRQVYSEVIELLYSKPHFHFAYPDDIPAFAGGILASRLRLIRTLSVDSTTNNVDQEPLNFLAPKGIANTILKMSSMEEFRIYVKGDRVGKDLTVRHQARKNFEGLRGLRVFEVYVPGGMAEYWKGFWEESTEARLVIWEDLAQVVPFLGRRGPRPYTWVQLF